MDEREGGESEEIVKAISNAVDKLKHYYSFTYGLIYTVATGKLDYCFI